MSRLPSWPGARAVREVPWDRPSGGPSIWVHPEWEERFPWLAQGVTGRAVGDEPADFSLFREDGPPAPPSRWLELAERLGFPTVVHAKQIHESRVLLHQGGEAGLLVGPDADGHTSAAPGLLMAVTVADCTPIYLVDAENRAVSLVHAGWRGVAAGILEAAAAGMAEAFGSRPKDLSLHLGPAICGDCYEVGPEVHLALGLPDPGGPTPVALRAVLAAKALALGVKEEEITRSTHCTRCGDSPFFSHRRGEPERQVGFLGIRLPAAAGLCGVCSWVRPIESRRGSPFLLCRRSETDSDFARYPKLPVMKCGGFEVASSPESPTP